MEAHSTGEAQRHRHASAGWLHPDVLVVCLGRLKTQSDAQLEARGRSGQETRATLPPLSFVWIANIPEEPRDDRLHGHVDGAEGDPAVYINLCQSQMESSFSISTPKKEITWKKN